MQHKDVVHLYRLVPTGGWKRVAQYFFMNTTSEYTVKFDKRKHLCSQKSPLLKFDDCEPKINDLSESTDAINIDALVCKISSLEPFENDNQTSLSVVNFSDYNMVNTNEILARKILQSEDWSRV
jgi:hypothetical protein